MAQAAVLIAAAVISAYSSVKAGNAKKKAADDQATILRENADATRAVSQRAAAEEKRNKELAYSRGLAVAAASGGGVDDPTVVNILSDINAEGQYRILSRLYSGESAALDMESQASIIQKEGRAARTAGKLKAASTLLSAYGSMGGGGFGKGWDGGSDGRLGGGGGTPSFGVQDSYNV